MLNLILNENMKIYRRARTWIMIGTMLALMFAFAFIEKSVSYQEDWRTQYNNLIEQNKMIMQDSGFPASMKEHLMNEIGLYEYALEHDIPPIGSSMWGTVINLSGFILLITLFTVVIAGDTVAGEFSTGTIKLLLIRPVSRSKILLSKYMTSFLFSLLLLLLLFIGSALLGGILYGFGGMNIPILSLDDAGNIVQTNVLKEVFSTYGYNLVQLIMIVTMAFMISTVFRSSSLSIGISMFLLMMGQTLTYALSRYEIVKYTLFANLDLTQYMEGRSPIIEGMTLPFSVTMLILYFVIFNALAWVIFKKRDVAA